VRPERQRRGIGRRLLEVAEALCRAEGCRVVELKVIDLRRELVRAYQRVGYHVDGRAEVGGKTALPCHFVVMHKPLGGTSEQD
jgi:GNAT superfamily N-acetyltransferase